MICRARTMGLILLAGIIAGCGVPLTDVESDHPLQGVKAPLFNTTYLDGTPFELADYLGQDVVILDFWATWCGPCRQALPILSEVAASYQDRGVRFFAVDLGEAADEVAAYVEQSGLPLTVVMDPDGSIAKSYLVEGIPQTVIIDRSGTVRFVHVGLSGDLRTRLSGELEQLLDTTAQASNRSPGMAQAPPSAPVE